MANPSPKAQRPATQDATSPAPAAPKRYAVFRFGSVSATVFTEYLEKGDRQIPLVSVSLRRAYRDAQGMWLHTPSLRTEDLLPAALALTKCYEFVEAESRKDDERH